MPSERPVCWIYTGKSRAWGAVGTLASCDSLPVDAGLPVSKDINISAHREDPPPNHQEAPAPTVAVWFDTQANGCNTGSASCIERIIAGSIQGASIIRVSCAEIAAGILQRARPAALVVGGGELSCIPALGEAGLALIREFVLGGGGYCGFCLGALISGRGYAELLPIEADVEADRRVFGGCEEGEFQDQHDFGNPADVTWMVLGKADIDWGAAADDGVATLPHQMMVSHPPIIHLMEQDSLEQDVQG